MDYQFFSRSRVRLFLLLAVFFGGIAFMSGQESLQKHLLPGTFPPVPEAKKDPLLFLPGSGELPADVKLDKEGDKPGAPGKSDAPDKPDHVGTASSKEIKPDPNVNKAEKHSGSVQALTAVTQPEKLEKPVKRQADPQNPGPMPGPPSRNPPGPPGPGSPNTSAAVPQNGPAPSDHRPEFVPPPPSGNPPHYMPSDSPHSGPLSSPNGPQTGSFVQNEHPENPPQTISPDPASAASGTSSAPEAAPSARTAKEHSVPAGTTVKVAPGVEGTTVKVAPGGGHPEKEIVVIQAPSVEKDKDHAKNNELHKYLKTPRKVFEFLRDAAKQTDYIRGTGAFDFSDFPKMSDQEKKDCVYKLDFIISRIVKLNVEEIPDLDSEDRYLFWPNIDYPPLELVKKGEIFQFGTKTINRLDDMYEELKDKPPFETKDGFLSFVPASWYVKHYGLSGIQWIGLLIFIILGYITGLIVIRVLYYTTLVSFRFLERSGIGINYKVTFKMWQPLGWLFTYSIWYLGIVVIKAPPLIADIVGYPIRFLCILMCMLTAFRLVDFISEIIRDKARKNFSKIDEILVPIFSRSMKMLIIFVGVVMAIQMIGFSVIGIVSGMGIGGIAVALAAQNTIANFFGSITVLMDQPFAIGDWIVVNGTEGEVEAVGMRSTRVRTFYNSLVTIPNNLLTTAVIDNMGRRHFRRYKTFVKVEYGTTPEVLELFCEGIRQLILSYPNTRKDAFHVYVNEMGDFSIDILLVCFFLVPDQASENKARSRLILDIMRLAEKLHVGFAFPSQTIYAKVEEDPGTPPKTDPPTVDEVRDYVEVLINNEKKKAALESQNK
ncbi:MAG: mechanosensitive ion channel [Planctomycetia bacterium]|nr:mechanosensitive ion channel [Planctomycetia bacterium]